MRESPKFLQGGAALPRPVLWAMVALSLGAGVLGYVNGNRVADLSETDAINVYARLYAQDTGGALTDCVAVPGQGRVWLIVRCGSGREARRYSVARDGRLLRGSGAGEI